MEGTTVFPAQVAGMAMSIKGAGCQWLATQTAEFEAVCLCIAISLQTLPLCIIRPVHPTRNYYDKLIGDRGNGLNHDQSNNTGKGASMQILFGLIKVHVPMHKRFLYYILADVSE
jgi:hypothetical protein